jgi:hypothetical protein
MTRIDPVTCWTAGADYVVNSQNLTRDLRRHRKAASAEGIAQQIGEGESRLGRIERDARRHAEAARFALVVSSLCVPGARTEKDPFSQAKAALSDVLNGNMAADPFDLAVPVLYVHEALMERMRVLYPKEVVAP